MPDMKQGDGEKIYTTVTAWQLCLLALCVWREARDQGFTGKLAVAWSIRNRVMKAGKTWWGDTWEEVIEKKWQYSSFNPDDPNAKLLPGDPATDPAWAASLQAAERAWLGFGPDPSQGATHYYNPSMVTAPAWVASATLTVKIQDHSFYIAN